MATCASCSGRGNTTCPSCGGRRHTKRLTANFDMDISACLVCGGRGNVRCQFCGGRGTVGTVGTGAPGARRAPRTRGPDEDVLAGRWEGQGGYYELVKEGRGYALTEYGAMGRTGDGMATLSGNTVTLQIRNVMLGQYSVRLQLQGDTLSGSINVMGIPMPFVLTRA